MTLDTALPLAGRHALVTGASRGIGAAIARDLSAAGAAVSLLVRDGARGAAVASSLSTRHTIVVADVTDCTALRLACERAASTLGPVDILVNNAGSAVSAPFLKSDHTLFARMIAEHVTAVVEASQSVLPSMLERGAGHIVNIASVAGLWGAPYITAYAAAKHAMIGLTRALALEVGPRGVSVNAVCPGYTETDLVSDAVDRIVARTGRTAHEAVALMLAEAQQSRLVRVDEVASAVRALCIAPGGSPVGQTLVLDGNVST
ncbi:MAG: SDR family oxidoreductase [Gemmatimonadaceae bacterium]|nr:SDR family oxidoreductase [Gemmatimonadaceae bacterium]